MNHPIKHFFRYQFPAMLWAIVIYILSSIPASKLPKFTHLINDKVIHISIFFVLGLLIYRALEPRTKHNILDWKRLLISVVAVIVYGMSDELHQGAVPGRTVDILDASADALGGLLSALAIYINVRRKQVTV